MNYLSVCSGIEAASAAWHVMGWKPVAFSEIEPFPSAVLKHHYPDIPNLGDMTKFDTWPELNIDLLIGGTPCQSFSVAGLRKGLDDDRGNLALTFCRIADRYDPEYIIWENVPGVLSDSTNAFGCLLGELCGADAPIKPTGGRWTNAGVVAGPRRVAAWRIIDAQYCRVDGFPGAVPQRRRRVFVVAHTGAGADPATVLFEPESLSGDSAPRREAWERVAGTVKGGSGSRGYPDPSDGNGGGLTVAKSLRAPPNATHREDSDNYVPSIGFNGDQSEHTRRMGETEDWMDHHRFHCIGCGMEFGVNDEPEDTTCVTCPGCGETHCSKICDRLDRPLCDGCDVDLLTAAIPEVCGYLSDGAHNGGGLNGQDAHTGRIIPIVQDVLTTRKEVRGSMTVRRLTPV